MVAAVCNVMAALVLSHAVLGCCWHHSHLCASCDKAIGRTEPSSDCCRHHNSSSDEGERSAPCRCYFQCPGVCVYLPTQKTGVNLAPDVNPCELLAVAAVTAQRHVDLTSLSERGREPAIFEPPLRLHLVHQVLLI